MTLPVTPPRMVHHLVPLQEISATAGRLHLNAGELLEALVLSQHGDGKVTLQVKNISIAAETLVALSTGERFTVRVEQTLPQVILRMVGGTEMQKITELLCLHRSDPGALANLFSGAKDILNPAVIKTHAGQAAAKSAEMLLQILDASVFSRTTAVHPLFLKDMMASIGLLLERNLLKGEDKSDSRETVKELLLKLAEEIRDANAAERLKETVAFLERGTKAIEGQQISAVIGQELDRSLVLQVACQFPAGIRMQDIFIDQETDGPDGLQRFHCVLLLSMDAIGEVIADASTYGNRFDCVLYCETPETLDFLTILLPELRDHMVAAGYAEVSVRCLLERNMKEAKSRRLAEKRLYTLHAVDIQT
ncbi:MAG: hypothetical protein V1766_13390 [Pseudomonadota bacterium]